MVSPDEHLLATAPGTRLRRFDNFFSQAAFDACCAFSRHLTLTRNPTFFTNASWPHQIIDDSFPVLIHPLAENHPLHTQVSAEILARTGRSPKPGPNVLFYLWTRLSYIPWHDDLNQPAGLTVYLNKQWSRDSGGLYLYEDDCQEIRGIVPKANLGVLQEGGVFHATTPVHLSGGVRMTMQVWLSEA